LESFNITNSLFGVTSQKIAFCPSPPKEANSKGFCCRCPGLGARSSYLVDSEMVGMNRSARSR
ncbi:unnamed protein product, partial [Gulo gulo]